MISFLQSNSSSEFTCITPKKLSSGTSYNNNDDTHLLFINSLRV